jgi:rhamnose transport system permease protein
MTTRVTVGVVPKSTRNPYFQDCHRGAQEAAEALGFELRWDGPPSPDAARQAQLVEQWTTDGIDVLAVSVESSPRLTPALKNARAHGIKVLTWDSDAEPEARDFTIVHATPESVAHALSFEVVRILSGEGTFAAITSTLTSPNQNAWIAGFKARLAKDYPHLRFAEVRPCNDSEDEARRETLGLIERHPDLKAIVAFCSPAVPGAAEAIKQAQRKDIRITGVSLPSVCRQYIDEGSVDSVVIWKTRNLGYLVGTSAHALATGGLQPGNVSLRAGRLGTVLIQKDEIRLGRCHIVTKGNLASFS